MMKPGLLKKIALAHLSGKTPRVLHRDGEVARLVEAGLIELLYDGERFLGVRLTGAGEALVVESGLVGGPDS